MLVRGAAGSIAVALLAWSAGLTVEASPAGAQALSPEAQAATQAPAAPVVPTSGVASGGPAPFLLPALPSDYFATTPHLLGEWPNIRSKLDDLGIKVSLTAVDEAVMNSPAASAASLRKPVKSLCRPNSTCKKASASRARAFW